MNAVWYVTLCYFAVNTITDLLWRRVLVKGSIVCGSIAIAYQLLRRDLLWEDFGMGLGIGILMIAISWGTSGLIGMGDGIAILVLGLLLGGKQAIGICMIAFILAGIVALYLMCVRKKRKDYQMPLIPFIMMALILTKSLS